MSDQQLEDILKQRRYAKELGLLNQQDVGMATLTATGNGVPMAVGDTLELDVCIQGVTVAAMVDTGSQSSIISRSLLHEVGRHLRRQGKPVPQIEPASLTLYGKDGAAGQHELNVTAQVCLPVETGGITVRTIFFVQPGSSQDCLLGMNVAPALGLSFLDNKGQPLRTAGPVHTTSASVNLVQIRAIPARSRSFVEANVDAEWSDGISILFEPDVSSLDAYGLGAPESILTTSQQGRVLVPVDNYYHREVHVDRGLLLGRAEIFDNEHATVSDVSGHSDDAVVAAVSTGKTERQQDLLRAVAWPSSVSLAELTRLKTLVQEYEDVFVMSGEDLGCTPLAKHRIDAGDHAPIKQYPRRTPFSQRAKISALISDMESKGVISPSVSPWASPVVLVPKKDGTTRFCVDFRRLNAITKKDVYPLPRIEDILDTLGRAQYFTTLDLAAGYWQIPLHPSSKEKTAFTTHCGLYEFNRMPFGLCNAPSTFQRLMQSVLAGLEGKTCFVYIDDILVCSRTFEEHVRHLQEVLDRLRKANLKLKVAKCVLLREQVQYLGHNISKHGITPDPAKVSKVANFPVPTDLNKLRQFLGLASYYRRFVKNFAAISCPLHALTKKGISFEWTVHCQEAFKRLKELLCTAPVLAYPQFGPGQEFLLETDASLAGLGAILSQKDDKGHIHPVAYASRSLHKHECNYHITELETLAIVWAAGYFRPYLLGHHCLVLTDHAACTSLLNSTNPSAKLARWAMIVQEMDLDIKYRPGKSNCGADALSRNPVLEAVVSSVVVTAANYSLDQRSDRDLAPLIDYLEKGTLPDKDAEARKLVIDSEAYDFTDGILYHESPTLPGRWCVVVPIGRREALIKEAHDGRFSGHFAEKKIFELLRRRYWWKGMRADVRRYCRSCLVCASRKGQSQSIKPPLQPIPVGGPFEKVGVDILQLPLTFEGNQYALVFIDYLTKWVEVVAIPDQKADTIAKMFVEYIVCRHGAPHELLSDRGANFLSELVREVCKLFDVQKLNTSGYHPQTNGLCERFNSTLIQMLAKTCERYGHDWDKHLPYVLYAYRVSVQASTGESPFFLLYGRDPTLPTLEALSRSHSPYMVDLADYKTELATGLNSAWKNVKESISVHQDRQKTEYDKTACNRPLQVGQRVMVYMPSEVQGKTWKFARPFHGPYRILSLTPTNAEVRVVDDPKSKSIFVSLQRIRKCYDELPDVPWKGISTQRTASSQQGCTSPSMMTADVSYTGPMTRSRTRAEERNATQHGD